MLISLACKTLTQTPLTLPEKEKKNRKPWHDICQNVSGNGLPARKALKSPRDLAGCENGASCEAPLMVAKERISP